MKKSFKALLIFLSILPFFLFTFTTKIEDLAKQANLNKVSSNKVLLPNKALLQNKTLLPGKENVTNIVKSSPDPVVIVLMVKNEESVMEDTLKPFVDAGVQSYLIYDTGSTDKTVEVTKKYFEKNNIKHAVFIEEPFIDFTASRNKALDLTEKYFPNVPFIFMIDAEWYTENVPALLDFCKIHANDDPNKVFCYCVLINAPFYEFFSARLIKSKSKVRFMGRVHETLNRIASGELPRNVYCKYNPAQLGWEKSQKRFERDRDWLLKDHLDDPTNFLTVYYLAQTFFCLNDLDNSAKFFKLYIQMDSETEYSYLAWYNLGKIYDNKAIAQKNDNLWAEAMHYYIKAYNMRPHRAEPLIMIAKYYLENNLLEFCYIFARRAVDMEYPKSEVVFVERDLYEYDRYRLLGLSAWFVNEFEIGEQATRKALEVQPERMHLQKNLGVYLDRKYQNLC